MTAKNYPKIALIGYSTIKLLLIALFSLSLNYASQASGGENIVCSGEDLLVNMAKTEPETLVKLRQIAAKTINGNGRFWKISKRGVADSWLFGTIHMADDKVSHMPQLASTAFEKSETVLVEITDMLDPQKASANIIRLKHLTFRLDGSTAESDLSPKQIETLKAAIGARALPYALAIRMQPWMLAPAISNQLCELAAKKNGKLFLDAKIMKMAIQEGKKLVALETSDEQLRAMASMPRKFQISMLVETLELGDRLDDVKETMKSLYVNDELALIMPVVRYLSGNDADETGFDEFQKIMIIQRNIKMAERANQYLEQGSVFMAVGALHLPGKNGLVALLEKDGFLVEAVDLHRE